MRTHLKQLLSLILLSFFPLQASADTPITHAFLACGNATYIKDTTGKTTWSYPHPSRDGWVLPNGNVLLALNTSKAHPGGAAVEVQAKTDGKTHLIWKGTQSELNTVQPLPNNVTLLSEAGTNPRLLEVDHSGKILAEIPIKAQTQNHHLQTRMSRKLANGNYLVPQLLDKVVREYSPKGEIVWEVKTPNMPFTAIRLENGNTLIGCTLGNLVIEVDPAGKTIWQVTNDDLPGRPINDACGVHRLPNGNTVITSHHAAPTDIKLTEISRDKQIVWTHKDPATSSSIHHFQILDTAGTPLLDSPLK